MKTIILPHAARLPILACGGDMKGAFALAKGRKAFLVEGLGDLSDLENFSSYARSIKRYEKKLGIKPVIIASDLHPSYYSARYAENYALTSRHYRLCRVQHHEAHVASCIVDNSVKGKVIGVAFDGTGYGLDGNMWGGEFFLGDLRHFKRAAHFSYVPIPGGDAAVREPWRMAVSYLNHAYGASFRGLGIDLVKALDKRKLGVLMKASAKGINSPLTSSVGRLFDACASIITAKKFASSEAELPMELEKMAQISCRESYVHKVFSDKGSIVIDARPLIRGIVEDLSAKVDRSTISGKLHNSVAAIISGVACSLRDRSGVDKVMLTGGVFQNRYLLGRSLVRLAGDGFKVYTHSRLPGTDSGIPIGQVAIVSSRPICV